MFRSRHSTFPLVIDDRVVGLATLSRVREVPRGQRAATTIDSVACPFGDLCQARVAHVARDDLVDLLAAERLALDERRGDRVERPTMLFEHVACSPPTPDGRIVTLWTGSACGSRWARTAWPAS